MSKESTTLGQWLIIQGQNNNINISEFPMNQYLDDLSGLNNLVNKKLIIERLSIVDQLEIRDAMNMGKYMANKMAGKWIGKFTQKELESVAFEGIAEAIQRFEPTNGTVQDTKFTSYAHFWITKYLNEFVTLNKTILSASLHDSYCGNVPYAFSIDVVNSESPNSDCTAMVKDNDKHNSADYNVISEESNNILSELISKLLTKLQGLDKIVIQMYFGIDTLDGEAMTIPEIAKNLGITKKSVQSYYNKALVILSEDKKSLLSAYFEVI